MEEAKKKRTFLKKKKNSGKSIHCACDREDLVFFLSFFFGMASQAAWRQI